MSENKKEMVDASEDENSLNSEEIEAEIYAHML